MATIELGPARAGHWRVAKRYSPRMSEEGKVEHALALNLSRRHLSEDATGN